MLTSFRYAMKDRSFFFLGPFMEAFLYFIAGIIVSIPISIFSPFITDRIRQEISKRSIVQSKRLKVQLEHDLAQAAEWSSNPGLFTNFLLGRILLITLATAIVGLGTDVLSSLGGSVAFLGSAIPGDNSGLFATSNLISSIASLLSAVGTIVIVQLCSRAFRVFNRVRNLDKFKEATEARLRSLRNTSDA